MSSTVTTINYKHSLSGYFVTATGRDIAERATYATLALRRNAGQRVSLVCKSSESYSQHWSRPTVVATLGVP